MRSAPSSSASTGGASGPVNLPDLRPRIARALAQALASVQDPGAPPLLAAAAQHAVLPGGAWVRPRLCLAVALACGDDAPALSDAAAVAVELLHCASLVHDDLPCFDNALLRRGRSSVHAAYGERLAVLAGDALIVLGYQVMGQAAGAWSHRLPGLLATLSKGVGLPMGIAAGQAWECESRVDLKAYQRAKTGALFAAAAMLGAQAAGAAPAPWQALGEALGEAYQVADDILDVVADPVQLGKPVGQDHALGRPCAPGEMGLDGAVRHFERLVDLARSAVPACPGQRRLQALVQQEVLRMVPVPLRSSLAGVAV